MKQTTKLVMLVIFALMLTLTACQRAASRAPVTTPTTSDEVPFPFDTPDPVSVVRTQTAIAQVPVAQPQPTETAIVQIETVQATEQGQETVQGTDQESGGGQEAIATQAPAPAQPVAAVEIPAITRPTTYTLQKGEWPICIARRYDLELTSFLSLNGMNMNSKPGVGTVPRIPTSGNWSAAHGGRALQAHPATYTVSAGDTINSIACRYGDVAPEQILAANGLSDASGVQSGMQLQIP